VNAGEDYLTAAVVDATKGYAYFGTNTQPGKIIKVRLSDFTQQATLTPGSGEEKLLSAVMDSDGGYAYNKL
jgi:hypothetical protein